MPDNKKSTETTRRINLTDRFYQYMFTLFSRLRLATITAATLLTACISETERLEELCAVMNAERRTKEHAEHCSGLLKKHAEFAQYVAQATSAEFKRERGDCCCTGAEAPEVPTVKLTPKEFAELKDILSHAQPIPPIPLESYNQHSHSQVVTDEDGNPTIQTVSPTAVVPFFYILDRLVLKDAAGKELTYIDMDEGILRLSTARDSVNAVAALPDEWFERYLHHPAHQRFIRNTNKNNGSTTEPILTKTTAQTEPHWKGPKLPDNAAQQNREFTEKVRQAANDCSSIQVHVRDLIYEAQNTTDNRVTLSAEHKTELCRILSQAQPILNESYLTVYPGKITKIIFLDEAGSELLSISSLVIGTPTTSTKENRIQIPSEAETRLREIIGEE